MNYGRHSDAPDDFLTLAAPTAADGYAELKSVLSERKFIPAFEASGAILFRNCGVDNAEKLSQISSCVYSSFHEYLGGGSPRSNVHQGVYTSTEYPPQATISQHIEGSYLPNSPAALMFCCVVAPTDRGQTPITDMRKVLQHLDDEIVERFRSRKVRYINNMHGGRGFGKSWMDTFGTNDRGQVEAVLNAGEYDFEWRPDGSLRTSLTCPGIAAHRETGVEYWFNQAVNWHPGDFDEATRAQLLQLYGSTENLNKYAMFGDGSEISVDEIETIKECLVANSIVFQWQRGDLLLLDNQWVAHGRQPFSGERKILVSMSTTS